MMGKAHLAKKVVEPVVETIPDNGLIGNDGIGNASNEASLINLLTVLLTLFANDLNTETLEVNGIFIYMAIQ